MVSQGCCHSGLRRALEVCLSVDKGLRGFRGGFARALEGGVIPGFARIFWVSCKEPKEDTAS